jgi:predicted P-loop ATPase
VVCGTIDIDDLRRDRDQLLAEALVAYNNKEKWWPDPKFESEYASIEQEKRYEPDPWEEPIQEFLDEVTTVPKRVTILEVAIGVLGYGDNQPLLVSGSAYFIPPRGTPINRIGTADQRRIAAVLKMLKWKRPDKKGAKGKRYWIPE